MLLDPNFLSVGKAITVPPPPYSFATQSELAFQSSFDLLSPPPSPEWLSWVYKISSREKLSFESGVYLLDATCTILCQSWLFILLSQCPKIILNKIAKTFNKIYIGLKSMNHKSIPLKIVAVRAWNPQAKQYSRYGLNCAKSELLP